MASVSARDRQAVDVTPPAAALLSVEESAELTRLLELTNAVMLGQPPPSDIGAEISVSFLRGRAGQAYLPFTLRLDPATVSGSVAVYTRLTPAGMTLPDPPEPDAEATAPEAVPVEPPAFPFEDAYFLELEPAAEAHEIRRALVASAGSYDLYVTIKDSEIQEIESPLVRRTVLKRTIEVPDLWTGGLTTSTVFVTDRVEPITAPLSAEQQRSDPYAIGSARIVPRELLQYERTDTLSLLFFVYNPTLVERKPNVTVAYTFRRRSGGGEQLFNATAPQTLSAETLPPEFDMTLGHQLSAGQNVGLSPFPPGAYRLEITITDNAAAVSITRDVYFTVVE